MKKDLFQTITDKIVNKIEEGALNGKYVMPWHAAATMPTNAKSNRPYSGLNAITLWSTPFNTHHWATYKQWQELGAQVTKGSKGEAILVPMTVTKKDAETGEEKKVTFFKAATVFNANQVEGYEPEDLQPATIDTHHELERIVDNSGMNIHHGGTRAYYLPAEDRINMPPRESFTGSDTRTPTESYYSVLVHEMVHATGHASRLDRSLKGRFGTEAYAMEELIAELGSAFVAAHTGLNLEPSDDNAKYVKSWLKVLKGDTKAIQSAATQASKAAAWLITEGN